eukprot:COSAG06_NODE_3148_length_5776_cov_3.998239_3_plen_58_part_00
MLHAVSTLQALAAQNSERDREAHRAAGAAGAMVCGGEYASLRMSDDEDDDDDDDERQ